VPQGGEQQVIGELMVAADGPDNGRRRCLGYMEFRAKLDNDREYAQRFQPVLPYIDASLAKNPAGGLRRHTAIHNRFSRPAPSVGDGPARRAAAAQGEDLGSR
jgi:hypothetical protein